MIEQVRKLVADAVETSYRRGVQDCIDLLQRASQLDETTPQQAEGMVFSAGVLVRLHTETVRHAEGGA